MLSKGGNEHMRTLNNTEWGGGGPGSWVYRRNCLPHGPAAAVIMFTKHLNFVRRTHSCPRIRISQNFYCRPVYTTMADMRGRNRRAPPKI